MKRRFLVRASDVKPQMVTANMGRLYTRIIQKCLMMSLVCVYCVLAYGGTIRVAGPFVSKHMVSDKITS